MSASDVLSAAVIGVGYLGRFHAEKYAALPASRLAYVVDTDADRCRELAARLGAEPVTDYREILGRVDVVSVVTPTRSHHAIARDFLMQGSHVLVEKPITATLPEAEDLVATARAHDRFLMVGHLERFNAARLALDGLLEAPRFIETHRLAPFKPRGTDVSVVLDLMIHDIDIILDIVPSRLAHVEASGTEVLTEEIDIANARLAFEDGCVANVTASRVSGRVERKMRIFQREAYLSVDFQERGVKVYRRKGPPGREGIPEIEVTEQRFENGDALKAEIAHFLEAVRRGTQPLVSGEDGLRALRTAIEIGQLLKQAPR